MSDEAPVKRPIKKGPLPLIEECQFCPFAGPTGAPVKPVTGIGCDKPKLVIIGEGPGRAEVANGVPFIGPSGRLVNQALAAAKVSRDEIWITNVTLCQPTHGGNKERLVAKASKQCRKRLLRELQAIDPSAPMLLAGKHAAQAFLGDEFKITELSGTYHEVEVPGPDEDGLGAATRQMIPTIHPAAILRSGDGRGDGGAHAADLEYWNFVYHVNKVKRLAEGEKPLKVNVEVEHSDPERADALLHRIAESARRLGSFAIDTETRPVKAEDCDKGCPFCVGHSALEPMHAKLTAIGIATTEFGISVSWSMVTPEGEEIIRSLFSDPDLVKDLHNRGYDEIVCASHELPIAEPINCTLLMHHSAFPGLSHRLQKVVSQYYNVPPWKAEFRHGKGTTQELTVYNATDTFCTELVKSPLQIAIKRSRAEKTYELDLKMNRVANQMQLWGIPINLEVNKELNNYFRPRIAKYEGDLKGMIVDENYKKRFLELLATEKAKRKRKSDPTDFMERHAMRLEEAEAQIEEDGLNLNSTDQIVALLKACGVPLFAVTKKGKTSTKKDVLEGLVHHLAVRTLLRFREVYKLNGTFVEDILPWLDKDLRAHPVWPVNKITGRWGSSPNFQNWSKGWEVIWPCVCGKTSDQHPTEACAKYKGIPKTFDNWRNLPEESKGIPNLRWQVVAPPGRMLVGMDKAQLEARIIAQLSKCAYLIQGFTEGIDIHSVFAADVFAGFGDLIKKSPEWSLKRDITKNAEYGYFYRAKVMTVWKTVTKEGFDIPVKTIAQMFQSFRKRMPEVETWHARKLAWVMQKLELREPLLGRRRCFPTGQADPTVIANFDVQAMGASIVSLGLSRYFDLLPSVDPTAKILIQGHDSVTTECDEDKVEKIKELKAQCFNDEYTIGGVTMKYPAEIDVGRSWAET